MAEPTSLKTGPVTLPTGNGAGNRLKEARGAARVPAMRPFLRTVLFATLSKVGFEPSGRESLDAPVEETRLRECVERVLFAGLGPNGDWPQIGRLEAECGTIVLNRVALADGPRNVDINRTLHFHV
eukprot:TRINITY_DN5080_c2_g1_i1.p2 TRINITY_DN5080_c2_g1~~TRINITY_DN5080_c2_g1_i1.p2  ORF type:complete len:126 (+),score=15.27 TRINITY_DN5080_c2_g1_i1:440-817(+)